MIDPQIVMKRGMQFVIKRTTIEKGLRTWGHDRPPGHAGWRDDWSLVRPADDDKKAWSLFLPDAPLANTGPKVFKAGQVWASCNQYGSAVYRVDSTLNRAAMVESIAGLFLGGYVSLDSPCVNHSVLLFDAPAESNQPAIPESPVDGIVKRSQDVDGLARLILAKGKSVDSVDHLLPEVPSAVRPCMTCTAPIDYGRLGPYQPRADICEMCISMRPGFAHKTDVQRESDERLDDWAEEIRRRMAVPAPARTLIVGGIVSPLRTDDGWKKR